jgi:putative phage-type endonuclease
MTAVDTRPVLLGTFEVASPEWHAARADGIGGSEIAAVLGLSRFESRFSLWHRKAGRIPPEVENNEMDAGKRLEPVICQKFADTHPEFVVVPSGTYTHPQRPWQIANPDRILYASQSEDAQPVALLEAKFALYPDDWGTEGTAEVPPGYLAQTRWYLDVFGLDVCYVEVFIGACAEFRTYVIRADETDAMTMREAGAEFMRTLDADERPDIDAHSATYEAVREMHPDIEPVDVELEVELVRAYCTARQALAAAESEAQRTKSLLADAIGNAKRGTHLGQPIAGRQAKGDGIPYLVAARNLPTFTEETS